MDAYLTDARYWKHWKGERCYVSWEGRNLFLNFAHDWMHNCIQDWTRKWNTALTTSKVWSSRRQGIITIFSGGMVGQLRELSRGKEKKWKLWLAPKGTFPRR